MSYNKHKKRSHRTYKEGRYAMQRFKNARPPKRKMIITESFVDRIFRNFRRAFGIKRHY